MSFTYTTLKTAIQDYTQNSETTFVANLDNFIRSAEDRIRGMVDLTFFRSTTTGTLTNGVATLAKPAGHIATYSLSVTVSGAKQFLSIKEVSLLQEFNAAGSTGVPRFYAPYSEGSFILSPTPDSAYDYEIHFFYRPTSLVDSTTTWLSTYAPNCLLYACLCEAYTFMKGEEDVMAMYQNRFQEEIARLKDLGEAREETDEYRVGLPLAQRT